MEKHIRILKRVGTGTLKPPAGSSQKEKKVELYQFDIRPPKNPWIGYKLPDNYEKILEESYFAIEPKALDTIEYLLSVAPVHKFNPLYKGFDTSIKELLNSIGDEFLHKAIWLISDYYFDKEKGYYTRISDGFLPKYVICSLAIYKYWCGRTGRAQQWYKAGFNKSYYEYEEDKPSNMTYYYTAQEILNYEKIQEKDFNFTIKEKQVEAYVKSISEIFPPLKYRFYFDYIIDEETKTHIIDVEGENELICVNNAKNKFYHIHEEYLKNNTIEITNYSFEIID